MSIVCDGALGQDEPVKTPERPGWSPVPFAALLLLGVAWGEATPCQAQTQPKSQDAGQQEGLVSAVAEVWLRSNGLVWEGPRVMVSEARPPSASLALIASPGPILVQEGANPSETDLRLAARGISLARHTLRRWGWETPSEFELYVLAHGDRAEPISHARALIPRTRLDRADVFATLDAGLLAFDAEACAAQAYALALLHSLDPAEQLGWRRAVAQTLTQDIVGRACTDAPASRAESPLRDPAVRQAVRAIADDPELWALARQHTWEGSGVRASPHLWEVLAYIAQEKEGARSPQDVWRQLTEQVLLSRFGGHESAKHPPFTGKTRRIWGDLAGLAPLGVEGVRFAVTSGQPLQLWLRAEPGTRWLLSAEARDGRGRSLTAIRAASKNTLRSPEEVVVYHPLERPPGTEEIVVWVGNMGRDPRSLVTPSLSRRSFHLVVASSEN